MGSAAGSFLEDPAANRIGLPRFRFLICVSGNPKAIQKCGRYSNLLNKNFHVLRTLHCWRTPGLYRKPVMPSSVRQKMNRFCQNVGHVTAIIIFAVMGSTALAATVVDFISALTE